MNTRLTILGLIFTLTLLRPDPAVARAKTDVIVMQNGDRMTCEIKGLDAGVLSVGLDYVDGTISVQWSKVARLQSTQQFIVQTEDGSVHSGILATADEEPGEPMKLKVTEPSQSSILNAAQVVKINETSERFLERFNGSVNFGINYSKGNDATQYSLGAQTNYLRERWAAEAALNSNLSSNSGSTTSTRQQLSVTGYHLLPKDQYFYEGIASFLQSSEQGINLQTSVGGGIGRFLKNTNHTTIAVTGGIAWQNTDYQPSSAPSGPRNATTALIAAEVKFFRFKKANLDVTAELFPVLSEPGRLRFNTNVSYYLKLISNLSWNVSFYGSWDNRPPDHFSGSDYGSSSGLKWTFGNQ